MDQIIQQFEDLMQNDWAVQALVVIVLLLVTFIVARLVTKFMRSVLMRDDALLPQNSIFVNITRAAVWIVGLCIIAATCFNVNVSAVIAALGVGGIAVSLGFQDTISNLIGGLQVSLMKIIQPGDNIEIGVDYGVVKDVSWHHVTIQNPKGETVIIPNSIINKTSLTILPPANQITLLFVVRSAGEDLSEIATKIEEACAKAVEGITTLTQDPHAFYTEVTDFGFRGKVIFRVSSLEKTSAASDAALRAIAPITRPAGDPR